MNEEIYDPETMIEDLKDLVEKKGLIHRKVAEKIGVTVATFSRWINGHNVPISEPVLYSIARFLKTKGKE